MTKSAQLQPENVGYPKSLGGAAGTKTALSTFVICNTDALNGVFTELENLTTIRRPAPWLDLKNRTGDRKGKKEKKKME